MVPDPTVTVTVTTGGDLLVGCVGVGCTVRVMVVVTVDAWTGTGLDASPVSAPVDAINESAFFELVHETDLEAWFRALNACK